WAGSGTGDFNVTLNGNNIVAEREFHYTHFQTFEYHVFGAFAAVTSLVQTTGNGAYTLSNLDLNSVINGFPSYCPVALNFVGWAIIIVYEDPTFNNSVVLIYDGFEHFSSSNPELNFTLQGLNVTVPTNNKIGILAWEGD